jgi:ergothioneine biosynthesis glutamate--cysteine ligase EgtA
MTDVLPREQQAANHIHGICLKNGPPKRVGVELEWLVRDARDPALPVPAERIAAAAAPFCGDAPALPSSAAPGVLPTGSLLTTEPGGQLELSSLPADTLADCVRDTAADLTALRAAAADAGLTLAGVGLDPLRSPQRILDLPRYAAMEEFFDRDGPWGRQMMCSTASVQVCLDAGDDSDTRTGYRWRWRFLHTIGPVLVAAFANSPLRNGRPTGWRSSRQQVWAHMDAGRTRPPRLNGDLRAGWADYALDARVMCVRSEGDDWTAPPGLTLRDWLQRGQAGDPAPPVPGGVPGRAPESADLEYHLSTLFPPVRPRGHFEIRMIDAQPGDGWVVPLAVVSALLADDPAAELAMAAAERIWLGHPPGEWPDGPGPDGSNPWLRAAMSGPADPGIARASRECFAAARAALARQRVPAAIRAAVDSFIAEYVQQDRCPADDLLKETT